MAKLIVYVGSEVREHRMEAVTTIGRHPDNTVQILEPLASRSHTRITRGAEGYVLEDLKSANGTEVNGRKVEKHILKHGDTIRIGNVRIIFEEEEEQKAAADIGPTLVARREDVGLPHPAAPPPRPEPAALRPGRPAARAPEPELSIMVPKPGIPAPSDRDRVSPRALSTPVESPTPASPCGAAHSPAAPVSPVPPRGAGPGPSRAGAPPGGRAEVELSLMVPKPHMAPPPAPGAGGAPFSAGAMPAEHLVAPEAKPDALPAQPTTPVPAAGHPPPRTPPPAPQPAAPPQPVAAVRTPPPATPAPSPVMAAGAPAGDAAQPGQMIPIGPQAGSALPIGGIPGTILPQTGAGTPQPLPLPTPASVTAQRIEPADFLLRLVAALLDAVILLAVLGGLLFYPIYAFVLPLAGTGIQRTILSLSISLLCMTAGFLYFVIQEGGSRQATFGKRLVMIRVMDIYGRPLTAGAAAIRTLCKAISALPCFLGFVWVVFSRQKQAWHDVLAGALVAMRYEEPCAAPAAASGAVALPPHPPAPLVPAAPLRADPLPLHATHEPPAGPPPLSPAAREREAAAPPPPVTAPHAPVAPSAPTATPAAVAGRRCPSCGVAMSPTARFCPECGTKVPEDAAAGSKCPDCGSAARPGAKFCGNCGRRLA